MDIYEGIPDRLKCFGFVSDGHHFIWDTLINEEIQEHERCDRIGEHQTRDPRPDHETETIQDRVRDLYAHGIVN